MRSLLKADFFSLLKSKITYVVLGICIGGPLLVVLLYLGLSLAINEISGEIEFASIISARDLMFSTFNMSSNVGLVIPIFTGILVMADIRNGTVRNKIIMGKSRTKIYFSQLIVSVTFCVSMALVSFLVMTGSSLIFFKYGYPFNGSEVWNFSKALIIGLLSYGFVAALATFFAMSTKSMPLTIVFTLLIVIGLSLMCNLAFLVPEGSSYIYIFYALPTYGSVAISSSTAMNIFGGGNGVLLTNEVFIYCLASLLGFITILTVAGQLIFNKTDLK